MGKPRFLVDDQWVRAYYKFGWSHVDVELELGLKPRFDGIRVLGDPVGSILHSILFPRLCDSFGVGDTFRAQFGVGHLLKPDKDRKIVCISYNRCSTDSKYHIAFQVRADADIEWLKNVAKILMTSIEKTGLAKNFLYLINK